MSFKILSLVLMFVLSTSCNRQEYDPNFYEKFNIPETSGKEIFDGDPEPKRPPLEESVKGVFGVDSDDDGVRDDVEIWINRYFDDSLKRKAYKEYYRHHALKLVYTQNKEREKLEEVVDESDTFLSACILRLYDPSVGAHKKTKNQKVMHEVFVNTKTRKGSYGDFIMLNRNIVSSADWERDYEYILEKCPFKKEEREELARRFKKDFDF